jgi:hypothetical protein
VIRDNLIRGIYCQNGDLAGPAVLMWQGSTDTIVERNTFTECSRGISLGLVGPQDHSGGVVRNNFIRWNPTASYHVDVPIYTTSPGSRVLHNSVVTNGAYGAGVEVRFAGATGVEVRGNLMDAQVWERDGADALVADNVTDAQLAWFVDEAAGDLHLLPSASGVIDQLNRHPQSVGDFDGDTRPPLGAVVDVGADELGRALFADGFESGDLAAWTSRSSVR